MGFVSGLAVWLAKFLASILIGFITLYGTYIAAFSNFDYGIKIFLFGCALATGVEAISIYLLVRGKFDTHHIYMGSLLSILLSAAFGYGGAYILYYYVTSASNPLLAGLFTPQALHAFILTAVLYASLQILFAAARAIAAYYVSHSRLARTTELAEGKSNALQLQPGSKKPKAAGKSKGNI